MEIITFKGSKSLVKMVLERLEYILKVYECVLVADYYDIVKGTSEYSDSKWGWLSLDGYTIRMTDQIGIYELTLPKALPLE